jgi:CubicO group peptidase (beta-lactamase class C family)
MQMFKIRVFCISLCVILIAGTKLRAQTLPEPIVKKVNSLFETWDKTQSPGCVVGIVRNDTLIFSKGYGMANLEYSIPNSPETIYHLASVSKQFTAYAIILLAQQGKLNLDDDIRKYLPWFPNLRQKITIRNLLNHTSGIRDQWQLLSIAGTRLDDVITQEQIIKILGKQQALNFNPGDMFSYSNSGYTLLAEIVKSVSGQSLRKFTDSAIFKPLGMTNTHFHDDYTEIEKNRSYSYDRKDAIGFKNSILSYSNAGATSLFSNVPDLSKWIMNFYNIKVGSSRAIADLTQTDKLNNGKELRYAAGIISANYKGWTQYWHNGADAGYRTFISVFPDLKMGIIVLSNLGEINTQEKANQITDLLIHDKIPQNISKEEESKRESKVSSEDQAMLKKQLGDYISETGNTLSLELKNDSLYCRAWKNTFLMMKESDNTFSMLYVPHIKLKFDPLFKDQTVIMLVYDETDHFTRYQKKPASDDKSMQEFTGVYYCPELDCSYGIILKDHQLYLTNNKYNDAKLTLASADHLLNDNNWWMNHLLMTRNNAHQITGFEVNSGRIMHLKFVKINAPIISANKKAALRK